MGLQLRSLAMLFLPICFSWLPDLITAQSTSNNFSIYPAARALDALLQDYAYRALVRPKTGIPYDAIVPSNLTGIKITAMRLRSGSLYRRGVNMYKEFQIPIGVVERPYVKRLVFVYQDLGNWSPTYYPLHGYTYLAPVLGLLAYNASNLSAKSLPELNIRASRDPISIKFLNVKSDPSGSKAKCVSFDLHGLVNFSNVVSDNICLTMQQGHFSIVSESIAPSPAPIFPSPTPSGGAPNAASPPPSAKESKKKKKNSKVWTVVGSVIGGLAVLALLAFLLLWVLKYKHKKKMQQMERAADVGEALHMTSAGSTKAPAATFTRTQPTLESEYAP